jgi:hypothetical protein
MEDVETTVLSPDPEGVMTRPGVMMGPEQVLAAIMELHTPDSPFVRIGRSPRAPNRLRLAGAPAGRLTVQRGVEFEGVWISTGFFPRRCT